MAPPRPQQASIVPAAAGLLLTPLLMYKLFAPEIKDTPEAPKVRCSMFETGVDLLTSFFLIGS